jgi:hypothetical protein
MRVSVNEGSRYGQQTLRQAARLAASDVCAKRRREPAERDRRLEKLATERSRFASWAHGDQYAPSEANMIFTVPMLSCAT